MLFKEVQYLRNAFIYILLAIAWVFSAGTMFLTSAPLTVQIITSAVMLLVSVFLYMLRFQVQVREDAVVLRFLPFFKERVILFEEMQSLTVHPISPISDYGGWGYRWMPLFDGVAYIMEGNMGATITLKSNGKKVAFSLKDAEGFKAALERSGYAVNR
ncbi:hypothetical protein BH09BAC1_BH09BAC1_22310 [soil metagenome]